MTAEYNVLSNCIASHGVPTIVIPNTPSCLYTRRNSGSCFLAKSLRDGLNPLSPRVAYCRIPSGSEPFLQIHKYFEGSPRSVAAVSNDLLEMGIVETLRGGTIRGPRGGTNPVVRVAVREYVSPVSAAAYNAALRQCRVLAIHAGRSMGDSFVRFELPTRPVTETTAAVCLLFDAPLPAHSRRNSPRSLGGLLGQCGVRGR